LQELNAVLKAEIAIDGPIDVAGRKHPDGSYFRLFVEPEGPSDGRHFRISKGAAEILLTDLMGLLGNAR
jgi:hypothetical protein